MAKLESIRYDAESDRWCITQAQGLYGLRCGESFDLYMGKTIFACRLERDTSWYVIFLGTRFTLHVRTAYTVRMQ